VALVLSTEFISFFSLQARSRILHHGITSAPRSLRGFQSSSSVSDIMAASESRTPTPYQISSTPLPTNHNESAPAQQSVSWSRAPSPAPSPVPDSQSHLFVCIRNNTAHKRDIKSDTSHTPLQFIVLLEPVHQQLPDVHLPSLAETAKPLLCNLTFGTPRCTSMHLSGTG
jgi:hypothetical protein